MYRYIITIENPANKFSQNIDYSDSTVNNHGQTVVIMIRNILYVFIQTCATNIWI